MLKNKFWSILSFIVGVTLAFALSGCPVDPVPPPPPEGTWEPVDIDIEGTLSNNEINFTYGGGQGTLAKNGGGNTLDGVWNGTFDGEQVKVTVSGGKWTMAVFYDGSYVDYAKGTVTDSSGTLTIKVTHVMDYGDDYEEIGVGGPITLPEVSTDGHLTITGLGAYNGEEVRAYCGNNNSALILEAVGKLQDTGESPLRYRYIAANITGGQATLKVYRQIGQNPNHTYSSYSGNDQNVSFTVWIKNTALDTSTYGSATVSFSNGIASGVFVKN